MEFTEGYFLGKSKLKLTIQGNIQTKRKKASIIILNSQRIPNTGGKKRNMQEGRGTKQSQNILMESSWNASWINRTDFLKLFFNYR